MGSVDGGVTDWNREGGEEFGGEKQELWGPDKRGVSSPHEGTGTETEMWADELADVTERPETGTLPGPVVLNGVGPIPRDPLEI